MKSRITIEIDFENNNEPVIQIIYKKSDDVRDNLVQSFLQKLRGESEWLKIKWQHHFHDREHPENNFSRIFISAIPPEQLKSELGVMKKRSDLYEEREHRYSPIEKPTNL